MADVSFEITSSLDTLKNQQITANFEEVAAWLDNVLQPYLTMAVTPDTMAAAKSSRANLRKVKDRIEEYRKEAKKAALAPYNIFEEKAKVLTGKIDAAVENIDSQVKAAENAEKESKIGKLHAEYVAIADDEAKEYCPWELIFDARWGNRTFEYETAVGCIRDKLTQASNDVKLICDIGGVDTAYLLDYYKQNRNISAVIRKHTEIKAAREREEQRKRAEAECIMRQQEANLRTAQESKTEYVREPEPESIEQSEIVTTAFRVWCTKKQLLALGQYMRDNGIKYRKADQ